VIAIVSIAATAAAWTLLSPADAAPKPQGVPGYEVVQGASFQVAALGNESADVACPVGKKVLGGGASGVDSLNESFMFLRASAPLNDGSGWHVRVGADPPTGTVTVIPWAVCATA
jgi:hypothetical protein